MSLYVIMAKEIIPCRWSLSLIVACKVLLVALSIAFFLFSFEEEEEEKKIQHSGTQCGKINSKKCRHCSITKWLLLNFLIWAISNYSIFLHFKDLKWKIGNCKPSKYSKIISNTHLWKFLLSWKSTKQEKPLGLGRVLL